MYQLLSTDGYKYPGQETYVLDIMPVATGFAATASDQTLSLFDPLRLSQGPVQKIRTDHGNLTAAKVYSPADSVICTAGENGTVSVWDLRLDPSHARALQIGGASADCLLRIIQIGNANRPFQETYPACYPWRAPTRPTPSPRAQSLPTTKHP